MIRQPTASLALLLLAASGVAAQGVGPPGESLERVGSLIETHRYGEARQMLARWWETSGDAAQGDLRARALYLRAVLSDDLEAAERDLLRLAVEHPQASEADDALFRLAHSRLAAGDTAAANGFLARLVQDHPQSGLRAEAQRLLGSRQPAAAVAQRPAPAAAPAAASTRSSATPARRAVEYTVQVASLPRVSDAEELRASLRAAGYTAYLARLGTSRNTVVRVGNYRDRASADAMARRLRAAGHATAAVTEVGS